MASRYIPGKFQRRTVAPSAPIDPGLIDVCTVQFNSAGAAEWGDRLRRGTPTYTGPLSPQQAAFQAAFVDTECHILMRALAGCSKSTSMERVMYSIPCNRSAMTTHQLGKRGIESAYGRVRIDKFKNYNLLDERHGATLAALDPKYVNVVKAVVNKLVGMLQGNLLTADPDTLDTLITHHGIEIPADLTSCIFDLVPAVLEASYADTTRIDFDNMLSFPSYHRLLVRKYDVLMVDESQDLNPAQQALILKSAKRVVVVGDENQAIYGFRGADVAAMDNLASELAASPRGLIELPLTVTRRCPVAVVELAQQLVPTFEAAPNAPRGKVEIVPPMELPQPGDMVLCRINAPLIQGAYGCLAAGVPARIQGRDFGQGLKRFIEKLANAESTCAQLEEALDRFQAAEMARLAKGRHVADKVQALEDKVTCLQALMVGHTTVRTVLEAIDTLFDDTRPNSAVVLFSSVHRAKGLEADTVRILEPHLMPHPMARNEWQLKQEYNILYVAVTRAKVTLKFHGTPAALMIDSEPDPLPPCPRCDGLGHTGPVDTDTDPGPGSLEACPRCGGTGVIQPFAVAPQQD